MDCKWFSTAKGGYAHCRKLVARTLWLAICLLSAGMAGRPLPVVAQDSTVANPCENGIVVPDPQDHPDLVAACEVLLTIHSRLTGDHHRNWNADTPINQWYGVVVSNSRVTELDLAGNLKGGIPPELSQLKKLRVLDLSSCILRETIPPELGQLENLETLDLATTRLTGSIPPQLGQLKNLKRLILSRNRLTETIPPELGQLENLETLDLYRNGLRGAIPPELGQLKNLETLVLGVNHLTGPIPPELGQLENLLWLGLSDNALTGAIPPELGQLQNLEGLFLSDNELTGTIPPELGQLENLLWLGLSDNELTGTIPPQLGQLTKLTRLYLHNNALTGPIPSELGQLTQLRELDLHNNALTGPIPPQLGQLKNLLRLSFSGNELAGPIPPQLGQLTELMHLDLHNNALTGPIPPELGQLKNLEGLFLSDNELTGTIPGQLGQLTRAHWLELSGNEFTCVPDSVAKQINDLDFPVCDRPPVVEPKEGKIYWTDMSAGDIQRANLDGSNVEVILEGGIRGPESIALDVTVGKMYWTDWNGDTGKIQRSDLDGSNSETLVVGLSRPGEIALDLVAGKMYYTDASFTSLRFSDNFFSARIMRADLDGSNAETVLSIMELVDDVSFPFWDILPPYQDIALDLRAGKMYWAGGNGIGRANLDGSDVETMLYEGFKIRGPESITLDVVAGKMYWTEWGPAGRTWGYMRREFNDDSIGNPTYEIHRADLDGSNIETLAIFPDAPEPTDGKLYRKAPEPTSITLDVTDGKMYWTDSSHAIYRANLDGSNAEPFFTGGGNPWGIALDIPGNKIYWTEHEAQKVQRADLDGTNVEVLLTSKPTIPVGLALDGAENKMYWTDQGTNMIRRADLDGANNEDLVKALRTPVGLALDVVGSKMYWTNSDTSVIQRADLDGSNVENILTVPDIQDISPHRGIGMGGIALDVIGGKMYWTDWQTVETEGWFSSQYEIRRANLDGTNVEVLRRNGLGSTTNDLPRRAGIALDLIGGKMYWTHESESMSNTDHDQITSLHRSNLDGSDVEDFELYMGTSDIIAVDAVRGKLYWSYRTKYRYGSFGWSAIHRSNLYGNNQEPLVGSGWNIGSIALYTPQPVPTLVSTHNTVPETPTISRLEPNYPNPFNSTTQISYHLATPGPVRLEVYNVLGQQVHTLVDQVQTAGFYQVPWNARDQRGAAVATGIYLIRLHYPGGVQTRRLLLLK